MLFVLSPKQRIRSKWLASSSSLSSALGALVLMVPALLGAQADIDAFQNVANIMALSTGGRVIVLHPGIFIDPTYDSMNKQEQLPYVSFYNQMLTSSVIYTPAQHDLAELFSSVLSNAEWATVPLVPAQVQELTQVSQLLYVDSDHTPTKGYARYLQKKSTYEEINLRYENTPEAQRTAELSTELQTASDDLDLAGHKAVYEPAETRLKLLTAMKSLQWRADDLVKVSAATVPPGDGNHWLLTETTPPLDAIDQTSWTSASFTRTQLNNVSSEPSPGVMTSPATQTWWHWGGAARSGSACAEHVPTGALSVEFDFVNIRFVRPWFDPQLFESQAWRLRAGTELFSDGNNTGNTGSSPVFATGIIVVKNLKISGDVVADCRNDIRRAVRNHQEIGFGPFRLSGGAIGADSSYVIASVTSRQILVPQLQIIGLTSEVLPKSPNPNPNFQWPSH